MTITLLSGKRIVLGVTGSIAAFKAVDLASKLTQAGAAVDCVLTESAMRFVQPLSFRSVTGRPAFSSMWDLEDHVRHVRLAESADLYLIAPATAHSMAKLAAGLADNLLTVTFLACRSPVLIAPAMDGGMYEHPATQHNIKLLEERGAVFAGPAVGRMASGQFGLGRMVEPQDLIGHIRLVLGREGPLKGRRVVVTAGPTRERLDPVRFMTNRSTGRQGIALAQAAIDAGAAVTLIAGPTQEKIPIGVEHVAVQSAIDMRDSVLETARSADILLMAAAVSDYRPAETAEHKIKKQTSGDTMRLELRQNPDILEAVMVQKQGMPGDAGRPQITVGFAAETDDLLVYGRDKLGRKGLDLIAINDIGDTRAGFEVETNRVILLGADGETIDLPYQSKASIAEEIVRRVAIKLAEAASQDGE